MTLLRATLLGALAACAGPPAERDDWAAELARSRADVTTAGDLGADLDQGFDPAGDPDGFARGDRAVFGLRYTDGDRVQHWTMRLEVVDPALTSDGVELLHLSTLTMETTDGELTVLPLRSRVLRIRVERFDDADAAAATSTIDVPRTYLTFGLADACAAFATWDGDARKATDAEVQAVARAVAACRTLLDVIQNDDLLSDVLWKIARGPSPWSVITHAGVEVSVDLQLDHAVDVSERYPGHPDQADLGTRWQLPMVIEANEQPALLLVADVVAPRSPWNLGAGVVALSARRPGDDDVRLDVQLLSARRAADR